MPPNKFKDIYLLGSVTVFVWPRNWGILVNTGIKEIYTLYREIENMRQKI